MNDSIGKATTPRETGISPTAQYTVSLGRSAGHLANLARRPSVSVGLRIIAAGLSFTVFLVAARTLPVADYGVLSMLTAAVNIGAIFSLLGHETLATRTVAMNLDDADILPGYRSRAASSIGLASIVTGLVVAGAFSASGDLSGASGIATAAAVIGLLLCIPRTRFIQGLVRGRNLPGLALIPDGIARPALTLALMLLTLPWTGGMLWAITIDMALAAIVALSLALLIERRIFARAPPTGSTGGSGTVGHFSAQIYLSSLLAVVAGQVSVLLAGHLAGSAQAALFDTASRISAVAALVSQSLYLAISPRIARFYALDDLMSLSYLLRRYTRLSTMFTCAVTAALALLSHQVMHIFGAAYEQAGPALELLLLSVLVNSAAGPTGMVLLMTKHEYLHTLALAISLIFQVLLCFALIPQYGSLGAGVAILLATLIWNAMMMFFIRSRLGLRPILAWA